MNSANRILHASFRAIIEDAKRRGFEFPCHVTITDGIGVAVLKIDDTKPHPFPFTLVLTDKNNRSAELVIDEPQPTAHEGPLN